MPYNAATRTGDGVVACCEDGTLVWLDDEGEIIRGPEAYGEGPLESIAAIGEEVMAVGEGEKVVAFNGHFYVSSGPMLFEYSKGKEPLRAIDVGSDSALVALSAYDDFMICALSTDGKIFYSKDAVHWSSFAFNSNYKGFYPTLNIRTLAMGRGSVAIAGVCPEDGLPAVYFSSEGKVWSPRELSVTEGSAIRPILQAPQKMVYDPYADRMVLLCSEGTVVSLPGCSHCTTMIQIEGAELKDVCPFENYLMLIGPEDVWLR